MVRVWVSLLGFVSFIGFCFLGCLLFFWVFWGGGGVVVEWSGVVYCDYFGPCLSILAYFPAKLVHDTK